MPRRRLAPVDEIDDDARRLQLAVELVAELLAATPSPAADSSATARPCVGVNVASNSVSRAAMRSRQTRALGRVALELPQLAQRARVEANLLAGLPPRLVEVAARDQPLGRARADRLGALLAGGQAAMKLQRVKLALGPSAVLAALADRLVSSDAHAARQRVARCAGGSGRAGR